MSAERYGAYSVLMSVYSKENPAWLKLAIESIQDQTLPTSDFVLVCDGPLTPELDGVIAEKHCQMGEILMVVRLEKNVGLGNALNEGIKHCRNELVARMDSDDIAYPDRCEKQVAIFNKYPIVSICSGTVMEFSKNPETINCKRVLPEKNKEIIEFAKKRNPFNHPCVMYKKSAVEAVGSYQHFYLLEDYYLWIRMLMAGYEGYNIQEPLLYMRAGTSMYKRRAGRRYAKTQIELFRFMWKQGFINAWQYAESCIMVVAGHGLIQERQIGSDEKIEFEVSGDRIQAVHMLPGYTHNIINLSETENLVTVMWANEQFDPSHPDTYFEEV